MNASRDHTTKSRRPKRQAFADGAAGDRWLLTVVVGFVGVAAIAVFAAILPNVFAALGLLLLVLAYPFVQLWPVWDLLLAALAVTWWTRQKSHPLARATHTIAACTSVGIGIVAALVVAGNGLKPLLGTEWVDEWQQIALAAHFWLDEIGGWKGLLGLTVVPFVAGLVFVRARPFARLAGVRQLVSRAMLTLTVVTSFTVTADVAVADRFDREYKDIVSREEGLRSRLSAVFASAVRDVAESAAAIQLTAEMRGYTADEWNQLRQRLRSYAATLEAAQAESRVRAGEDGRDRVTAAFFREVGRRDATAASADEAISRAIERSMAAGTRMAALVADGSDRVIQRKPASVAELQQAATAVAAFDAVVETHARQLSTSAAIADDSRSALTEIVSAGLGIKWLGVDGYLAGVIDTYSSTFVEQVIDRLDRHLTQRGWDAQVLLTGIVGGSVPRLAAGETPSASAAEPVARAAQTVLRRHTREIERRAAVRERAAQRSRPRGGRK